MGEVDRIVLLEDVSVTPRAESPGTERDCGESCTRSHGMDGIRELISAARDSGLAASHFRGLLHIAIGRKITRPDGTVVSMGLTWRVLAQELKSLRFDQELVRKLELDPDSLVARDRERFWYTAISLAHVDSPEAVSAGDQLVPKLKNLGYIVGPAPTALLAASPPPAKAKSEETKPAVKPKEKENEPKAGKKKKK
jgi:hypothetical protein